MTLDVVTLRVGGVSWIGWTSVQVSAGIELAARAFRLEVSRREREDRVPIRITPGASCEVWAGADRLVTGYVDRVEVSYDAQSERVTVVGRSRTGDLVDCSVAPSVSVVHGHRIDELAGLLAAPFEVSVVMDADADVTIRRHVAELGESVYESIERACRTLGLLVTDDEDGRLLLTRAGTDTATDGIVRGENVISCSASFAADERYSRYQVRGQVVADDNVNGSAAAHPEAILADDGVDRYRLLVLTADTPADVSRCRDLGRFEAANRAGRASQAVYTLAGWRQSDGELWRVNTLVDVTDPVAGFDEVEMLITAAEYQYSEAGQTVDLTVAPASGYELIAPADRVAGNLLSVDDGIEMWVGLDEVEIERDLGPLDEIVIEVN